MPQRAISREIEVEIREVIEAFRVRVTYNGEPVEGATVVGLPKDPEIFALGAYIQGTTDAEGKIDFTTINIAGVWWPIDGMEFCFYAFHDNKSNWKDFVTADYGAELTLELKLYEVEPIYTLTFHYEYELSAELFASIVEAVEWAVEPYLPYLEIIDVILKDKVNVFIRVKLKISSPIAWWQFILCTIAIATAIWAIAAAIKWTFGEEVVEVVVPVAWGLLLFGAATLLGTIGTYVGTR